MEQLAGRPPLAPPDYRYGVTRLYRDLGVSCLPVAVNSGLFWPRRKFLRYPGTIRVEVLDPIPPGLDQAAFMARLQSEIETATARLIAEGASSGVHLERDVAHVWSFERGRATGRGASYPELYRLAVHQVAAVPSDDPGASR